MLRGVLKNYRNFYYHFAGIIFLFSVIACISAYTPYLLKEAINKIGSTETYLAATAIPIVSYAFFWTAESVLQSIKGIFSAYFLSRSEVSLLRELNLGIYEKNYTSQSKIDPGETFQDINRAATALSQITYSIFLTILPIFIEIAASTYFIFISMGFSYTVVFCLSIASLLCISYFVADKTQDLHTVIFESANQLSSFTISRLSTLHNIKFNRAINVELRLADQRFENYVRATWTTNKKMGIYLAIQSGAIGLVLLVFTVLAARTPTVTAGDFAMVAGYVAALALQLRLFAGAMISLKKDQVALSIGQRYLPEDPASEDSDALHGTTPQHPPSPPQAADTSRPVFSLRNVEARIAGKQLAIARFDIQPGQFLAISGPSGLGKSTLSLMMLGQLRLDGGTIDFCGTDVSKLPQDQIFDSVSYVQQEVKIVEGTVRDNLLYGTPLAPSDHELASLLTALNFNQTDDSSDSASLELDDSIGLGGRALSGGECRRIAIARAILRRKPVLFLDEPTAGLDSACSARLMAYLQQLPATLICISHDEVVLSAADQVLQLNDYCTSRVAA